MSRFCLYRNKAYKFDIDDYKEDTLELISNNMSDLERGFIRYIDELGKIHSEILVKEVTMDEVELVYELQINAIYKGKEFETYAVGPYCLEKNSLALYSMEPSDMKTYSFEKKEQFVFKKDISLDEVESLVEIKTPILEFEGNPESRRLIPNNLIKEYIRKQIDAWIRTMYLCICAMKYKS